MRIEYHLRTKELSTGSQGLNAAGGRNFPVGSRREKD